MDKVQMTIMEAIEKLDNLVDESDPCHNYVSHVYIRTYIALGRYFISSQKFNIKNHTL